jgi:HEPN domain-containing protein
MLFYYFYTKLFTVKKILILAYDFPPYVSVGGLRPYSWYKHLKEFGVYPVVVTRQWDNKFGNNLDYIAASKTDKTEVEETEYGTILRSPYKPNLANRIMLKYGDKKFRHFRRLISAFYEVAQWFFNTGTKYELYKAAATYLQNNSVDAIIATGEPFILFKYASKLSNKYNIPWIADYRDTWSQDRERSKNIILRFVNTFLEKRILKNVSHITTVSQLLIDNIKKNINIENFSIIINGYDDSITNVAGTVKQEHKVLSIAYAGSFYKWHPIESFLEVCSLFADKYDFTVNFYGINNREQIEELIKTKYINLHKHISIHNKLPYGDLIKKLARNNLLLLFNYYSFTGTKIYDYLAVKRKILFCYSNDTEALRLKEKYYNLEDTNSPNNHLQEDIIKETNSGVVVKNEEHLKQVLKELQNEFIKKRYIECNSTGIEKYSRKIQVKKLANIILTCIIR